MNRVVVTGATGLVGRQLVQALQAAETSVTVAQRDSSARLAGCQSILPFDLAQPEGLRPDQLSGIDVVYHLAARVHVMKPGAQDEREFERHNMLATRILAERAAQAGARRFVYVSSIKVNGEQTAARAFTAHDVPQPQDAYARSKRNAESALEAVAAATGLEVVIVRPPLVYGPGVRANFQRMISLVDAGLPLPFGAIQNRRSLVGVWNLVDLLIHAGTAASAPGRVWMVSDDDDVSTPRLLELLARALGRKARLIPLPGGALRMLGALAGRQAEVARLLDSLQVDISTTKSVLAWRPPMGVEEGISRTVAWYKAARNVG